MKSIFRLIERFRARHRMQQCLLGAVEGSCLGLMLAGVGIAAMRTGFADPDGWWIWALIAVATTLLFTALRGMRSVDLIAAAQRIDNAHGLHDRLSTAVALAMEGDLSTGDAAFVEAQLKDALRHVERVEMHRAAPWRTPADTKVLAAVALAVIVVGVVPIKDHKQPLPEAFRVQHGAVLDETTLALERDRLRQLRRRIAELPDEQAEKLADEIEALLDAVERREISEREFLDAIDDLIERYFGDETLARELETFEDALAEAAKKMRQEHGEALKEHPELEEAIKALEDGDLKGASEALQKLAEKLENEELTPEQAERLADMLERFSEQIDGYEEHLKDLFEKHRDAFEELSERFQDQELTPQQQDLLDDARQAMEDAQKNQDDFNESMSKRQLEQLSRQLDEAAEELRDQQNQPPTEGDEGEGHDPNQESAPGEGGDDGERSEIPDREQQNQQGQQQGGNKDDEDRPNYKNEVGRKMDDASRQLDEMDQERQRQEQREQARRQLEEMREGMSRSQSTEDSEREERRREQIDDFMERARGGQDADENGQDGTPQEGAQGEDAGRGEHDQSETGDGEYDRAEGEGAGRGGDDGDGDGLGPGDGENGGSEAQRTEEQVQADMSAEGRSRSEIIRSASEEGFTTIDYQDVFADYHDIAEEVMERESVPDGYRYYIKRYFQLIRPQQ